MVIKQYQFGHVNVEIQMPDDIPVPENMRLFEKEIPSGEIHKICKIEFSEELHKVAEAFQSENAPLKVLERKNMHILTGNGKECRIIRFEGAKAPYGVHMEESENLTHAWVSRDVYDMLHFDTVFVSLLGLEKVMIRSDAIILHCAYMLREGKAVLFSAPSGTGKSTQAELWEKYRGTRTVNGDHALLIREENGWHAYGWPICGSSEICHNESYPIEAVVMLYQAKENKIQRLKLFDAVKKIMPQVTMNMWNTDFQIRAMDLIQELAMDIPVYELGCDISEAAVKCLEMVLAE